MPIFTDAAYFVSVLKEHLESDGCFLPDSRLRGVPRIQARVSREHKRLFDRFDLQRTPEIIYAAAYQDGLEHAFSRVLAKRHTGDYSHRCELVRQIQGYENIKKQNLQRHRYDDVAYVEGYMAGLVYLLMDDDGRLSLPLYFGFGMPEMRSFDEYRRALARYGGRHKAAAALARRLVRESRANEVLHHQPFLNWSD